MASAGQAMLLRRDPSGQYRDTDVYRRRNEELLQRQRTDMSYQTTGGQNDGHLIRNEGGRPIRGDRGPRLDRHKDKLQYNMRVSS